MPGGKVLSDNSRKADLLHFLFWSEVFSEMFASSPYAEGHDLDAIQHTAIRVSPNSPLPFSRWRNGRLSVSNFKINRSLLLQRSFQNKPRE